MNTFKNLRTTKPQSVNFNKNHSIFHIGKLAVVFVQRTIALVINVSHSRQFQFDYWFAIVLVFVCFCCVSVPVANAKLSKSKGVRQVINMHTESKYEILLNKIIIVLECHRTKRKSLLQSATYWTETHCCLNHGGRDALEFVRRIFDDKECVRYVCGERTVQCVQWVYWLWMPYDAWFITRLNHWHTAGNDSLVFSVFLLMESYCFFPWANFERFVVVAGDAGGGGGDGGGG